MKFTCCCFFFFFIGYERSGHSEVGHRGSFGTEGAPCSSSLRSVSSCWLDGGSTVGSLSCLNRFWRIFRQVSGSDTIMSSLTTPYQWRTRSSEVDMQWQRTCSIVSGTPQCSHRSSSSSSYGSVSFPSRVLCEVLQTLSCHFSAIASIRPFSVSVCFHIAPTVSLG